MPRTKCGHTFDLEGEVDGLELVVARGWRGHAGVLPEQRRRQGAVGGVCDGAAAPQGQVYRLSLLRMLLTHTHRAAMSQGVWLTKLGITSKAVMLTPLDTLGQLREGPVSVGLLKNNKMHAFKR